jgi:L,D-transpeptidase ErfK/SrfK
MDVWLPAALLAQIGVMPIRVSRFIVVTLAVASVSAMRAASAPIPISAHVTGAVQEYIVGTGDTLVRIGARFGVDPPVLAAANGLRTTVPLAIGRVLTIDNRHIVPEVDSDLVEIVVNVPQRMLFAFHEGVPVHAFPIAAGRPSWRTPIALFRIVMKEEHPTWDVPLSIQEEMRRSGKPVIARMPPGPNNPLGDHWIGLSIDSLGIHGTPYATTIYHLATHGCLRLHPDDVKTLFDEVVVGTRGAIVYEPVLIARTPAGVFLEAHADAYRRRGRMTVDDLRRAAGGAEFADEVDWDAAAVALTRRDGVARLVSVH